MKQPWTKQWVLSQGCQLGAVSLRRVAGAEAGLGCRQQHTQEPMLNLQQGAAGCAPKSM